MYNYTQITVLFFSDYSKGLWTVVDMSLPDNIVPGSVRAKVAVIGMVTILLTLALRLYTFFILNLNEFEISNVHKHFN